MAKGLFRAMQALKKRKMDKSLWARLELPLATTKENIWLALTLPELTKQYMYNCQLHCSWELGSDALWRELQEDGSFITHVSGTLLEYQPYFYCDLKSITSGTV